MILDSALQQEAEAGLGADRGHGVLPHQPGELERDAFAPEAAGGDREDRGDDVGVGLGVEVVEGPLPVLVQPGELRVVPGAPVGGAGGQLASGEPSQDLVRGAAAAVLALLQHQDHLRHGRLVAAIRTEGDEALEVSGRVRGSKLRGRDRIR